MNSQDSLQHSCSDPLFVDGITNHHNDLNIFLFSLILILVFIYVPRQIINRNVNRVLFLIHCETHGTLNNNWLCFLFTSRSGSQTERKTFMSFLGKYFCFFLRWFCNFVSLFYLLFSTLIKLPSVLLSAKRLSRKLCWMYAVQIHKKMSQLSVKPY